MHFTRNEECDFSYYYASVWMRVHLHTHTHRYVQSRSFVTVQQKKWSELNVNQVVSLSIPNSFTTLEKNTAGLMLGKNIKFCTLY